MYGVWKISNIDWVALEDTITALENRNLSFLDAPNHVMSDNELSNELFISAKEDYIDWEIYEKTGRLPKSYEYCPDEVGNMKMFLTQFGKIFTK
ncbi:MAG: hypothetical protein IKU15_05935 [Clostridia bacterium]|nr:hypothetical protein [Clostridia bacterium]